MAKRRSRKSLGLAKAAGSPEAGANANATERTSETADKHKPCYCYTTEVVTIPGYYVQYTQPLPEARRASERHRRRHGEGGRYRALRGAQSTREPTIAAAHERTHTDDSLASVSDSEKKKGETRKRAQISRNPGMMKMKMIQCPEPQCPMASACRCSVRGRRDGAEGGGDGGNGMVMVVYVYILHERTSFWALPLAGGIKHKAQQHSKRDETAEPTRAIVPALERAVRFARLLAAR
ncbi:hypothetical protein NUW54_g2718 [Trametes sanguinea]|uniref:Uncharacterized protein n=1 Tax=Trametes sanguinea TaxID=158606 RepID=A0ACC1Q2R3_9APHY|nr:hypothetical protein NUW54_g2718 [Trametes sanguinea]